MSHWAVTPDDEIKENVILRYYYFFPFPPARAVTAEGGWRV